jgi:hypothetical protein
MWGVMSIPEVWVVRRRPAALRLAEREVIGLVSGFSSADLGDWFIPQMGVVLVRSVSKAEFSE